MYKFTLSNFWYCVDVNSFFYDLIHKHKEYFNSPDIIIVGIDGSLPQSYWQGDHLNNVGFAYYQDIVNLLDNHPITLEINCTNSLLNSNDLYDTQMKLILDACNNGDSIAIINSQLMLDFFKSNYSNYRLIYSNSIKGHDLKNFNHQDFYRIRANFGSYYPDIPKYKQEICVASSCIECKQNSLCYLQEQNNIYHYGNESIYLKCDKIKNTILSWTEIKKLHTEGFSYFYFDTKHIYDSIQLFDIYLRIFIKPNYQTNVKSIFLQEKISNG